MILIGVGANLEHPRHGGPRETCAAALALLEEGPEVSVVRRSNWYRSAPVPISDQPWFVNAVAELETGLEPAALLARLHEVERYFGRVRRERNEARVLDLDLLAYHDRVSEAGAAVRLPHPRLAERAFVLLPLVELAPNWRHPADGRPISALVAALPGDQRIEVMS